MLGAWQPGRRRPSCSLFRSMISLNMLRTREWNVSWCMFLCYVWLRIFAPYMHRIPPHRRIAPHPPVLAACVVNINSTHLRLVTLTRPPDSRKKRNFECTSMNWWNCEIVNAHVWKNKVVLVLILRLYLIFYILIKTPQPRDRDFNWNSSLQICTEVMPSWSI